MPGFHTLPSVTCGSTWFCWTLRRLAGCSWTMTAMYHWRFSQKLPAVVGFCRAFSFQLSLTQEIPAIFKDAKLEPALLSLEKAMLDVFGQSNARSTWDELSGLGSLEHLACPVSAVTKIATQFETICCWTPAALVICLWGRLFFRAWKVWRNERYPC